MQRLPRRCSCPAVWALFGNLKFSPDKQILAANIYEGDAQSIAFFDPVTAKKMASIKGSGTLKWISNNRLLISDEENPLKFCTINSNGDITTDEISKGGGFHTNGNPIGVSGQAVSADEKHIWQSYEKIGALMEFDLTAKESKALIVLLPNPYAMDVREVNDKVGFIATAGDDKYVRLWNLVDLSLVREIATTDTPQGISLLTDGKRFVYSQSSKEGPTTISIGDILTGSPKVLLKLPKAFVGILTAGQGFVYPESLTRRQRPQKPSRTKIQVSS